MRESGWGGFGCVGYFCCATPPLETRKLVYLDNQDFARGASIVEQTRHARFLTRAGQQEAAEEACDSMCHTLRDMWRGLGGHGWHEK